ncbi:MAG: sugar phosphate isomerase/epimerase family protein [Armatimonadota bacterium]|jgi:xylose isomerase
MQIRHSVIIGFLGRQMDRFTEYQPGRTVEEKLEMAQRVEGIQGVEVVYPVEFEDVEKSIELIRATGLEVSAVNLNLKQDPKWSRGSLTSADPQLRADAVADMRAAMDIAAELGANLVTCCPLIDGHDYAFQIDYTQRWRWLVEGVREGAQHRSDVRVSMEYKSAEPRTRTILPDCGRALHMCNQVGLDNVGVTLDLGHAFAAQEAPAESVCLLQDAGRLFYVHFNDNPRDWDWDMLPAAVHPWDFIETLFYLDKLGWDGWFAYDVVTKQGDPVESFSATIKIVDALHAMLDKLGRDKLQEFIDEGIPARAFEYLVTSLV